MTAKSLSERQKDYRRNKKQLSIYLDEQTAQEFAFLVEHEQTTKKAWLTSKIKSEYEKLTLNMDQGEFERINAKATDNYLNRLDRYSKRV